jgi:hypothetical protein
MGLNEAAREFGAADVVDVDEAAATSGFSVLLVRKKTGERATSMASCWPAPAPPAAK